MPRPSLKVSFKFSVRELKNNTIIDEKKLKRIIRSAFKYAVVKAWNRLKSTAKETEIDGFHIKIFREEIDPNSGSRWSGLDDKTIKKRKVSKRGIVGSIDGLSDPSNSSFPILRETNRMAKDFIEGSKITSTKFTNNTITINSIVQSKIDYARFHMRGTKWMPERPFLPNAKAYERIKIRNYISRLFHKYIKEKFEKEMEK